MEGAGPILRFIASVISATYRLAATLLRLIHSEIRLLCGIDAAIGAAAGYYFHNGIVGAMIGKL